MPLFDPLLRRLVVRIVYDGPGFAGKTTNIQRICEELPVERRTEMYTPGSLKGRTMFFDWLELDAGRLGGMSVRCQLLSVPGQAQRSYRRKPLLMSADAVVFVADSALSGLSETKRSYNLLRRYLREREPQKVPFLVQANKQDAVDALSPDDVARALRARPDFAVVPARAASGFGVRDTLMTAMKMALRDVQDRVKSEGLAAITGQPQTADDLFEALLELEEVDHSEDPPEPDATEPEPMFVGEAESDAEPQKGVEGPPTPRATPRVSSPPTH